MKKLFLTLIMLITYSCHFPWDSYVNIEKEAHDFLNALRKKDIALSKSMCTEKGANFIDSCIRESLYFQVTEVKDIKCKIDSSRATCFFCCLADSLNPRFTMNDKERRYMAGR